MIFPLGGVKGWLFSGNVFVEQMFDFDTASDFVVAQGVASLIFSFFLEKVTQPTRRTPTHADPLGI